MMLVTRGGVMGGVTGSAAAASRDLGGTGSATTIVVVGIFVVGVIVTVATVTSIVVVVDVVAATNAATATATSTAAALFIIPVWAIVFTVPIMITVNPQVWALILAQRVAAGVLIIFIGLGGRSLTSRIVVIAPCLTLLVRHSGGIIVVCGSFCGFAINPFAGLFFALVQFMFCRGIQVLRGV